MITLRVRVVLTVMLAAGLALVFTRPAWAGWGDLIKRQVKKKVQEAVSPKDKDKDEQRQKDKDKGKTPSKTESASTRPAEDPSAAPSGVRGKHGVLIFSDKPIDPKNPPKTSKTGFKAGDTIYGLMTADKTWRELFGRKYSKDVALLVRIDIDGKRMLNQYVTMTQAKDFDHKQFVLDIAPDVAKMTNYRDKSIKWSTSGNRTIGPSTFTHYMGEMKPGKHTVRIGVYSYGGWWVAGEFTIDGAGYQKYAELHKQINQYLAGVATMPPARMVNKSLANEMLKLCVNAGWENIVALNIVDKDWWIDRVRGGNSRIKSRHMDAAVAAKAEDGSYYYCVCQFHQMRLIHGSWAQLELTHTGKKHKVPAKGIVPNVKDGKIR